MVVVGGVLVDLEPVVVERERRDLAVRAEPLRHDLLIVPEPLEAGEDGEQGLFPRRTQIGEDGAQGFDDRIPGLADAIAQTATVRFARLVQADALVAEFPAVVAAADAVLLDPPVHQARAPVGAARIEQPGLACLVAEQDKVLAEPADQLRQVGGFRRQGDRLPVAPEQLPALRPGADQGEHRVEVRRLHAVGPALRIKQPGVHVGLPLAMRPRRSATPIPSNGPPGWQVIR